MEVISVIHSIMAVAMSLWTYSRYSRRCATSYGDDFVFGHVNDVGYVTSEGGGSVIVSYEYSFAGKRYFGSFIPPWRHLIGFKSRRRIEELEAILREQYPTGFEVNVFYFRGSPAEHWLYKPPTKWAVFQKALWLPLLTLVLICLPLGFVQLLIHLSTS